MSRAPAEKEPAGSDPLPGQAGSHSQTDAYLRTHGNTYMAFPRKRLWIKKVITFIFVLKLQ